MSMHLDAFIKQEPGMTQGKFGALLDPPVTQGLVGQWCRGETRVTLPYAIQIKKLTRELVTPEDCDAMYIPPHLRGKGAKDSETVAAPPHNRRITDRVKQ